MFALKIQLCIITTLIVGISCSPTSVETQAISEYGGPTLTNTAALFEPQSGASSSYDGSSKTFDIDTQNRKQTKDTGFDVPIDGFHFDNNCDHSRPWLNRPVSPGFDSGFNGNRPGFGHGGSPGIDPGFGQRPNPGYDSGFDGTGPGFVQKPNPGFDAGFDGTRPGFGQKPTPGFDAGFDGTRPGFSNGGSFGAASGFEGTRPGYAGGYNVNRPGFAESPQFTRPWFNQRTRRQVSYPSYGWQSKFDEPQQFGFVNGFESAGPGYGQYSPPDFDSGFDDTRLGFIQRIRREALSDNTAELQALEDTTFNANLQGGIDSGSQSTREEVDSPGRSQKFFFLQPHKNNMPFIPGWPNQPMRPYPPYPYDPGYVGSGNPYNPSPYGNPGNQYNPGIYGNSGTGPGPYW